MNHRNKPAHSTVSLRNLADEITHQLRRDIVEGEIRPGTALAEPVLAERFGSSRAPVREALIALEREGLVEFNERSRTHVRRLAAEDFEEIRLMRIALESLAARLAAGRWNQEHTRAIEENLRRQEAARTLGELSHLDVELHEYVVRLSGHRRLIAAWLGIRWQFEMCLAYTHRLQEKLAFEPRRITVNAHRHLLTALACGEPELAEKTMAAHIRGSAEWFPATQSLEETSPAESATPVRKRRLVSRVAKIALVMLAGGWSLTASAETAPQNMQFFESKVQPLLVERCYECHSHEKKIKGGLVLDSRSGWEKGGETGAAILPGKPEESLLIKAVRHGDKDLAMPPKKKLSDDEIAVLTEWVKMGAPDPREGMVAVKKKGMSMEERLKHWAFQPLHVAPHSNIDDFVSAGPEADRYTLLRRVSFDLTGLPPTREDMDAFVHDTTPDAFARLIDRLLSSPAYGERWARHWLDIVGYADQIGTANNIPATHAWRYRDYVIRTFNADKPFDVFIHEQIAGDLMPSSSVTQRQDQLAATGFLLLGNISIVESDKDKLRVDVVDQQIEKVGKAFLGMTLNCVRCHDHKFDPVTLQDYYGLAGIFMSTDSVYWTKRGVWSAPTTAQLPETEAEQRKREQAKREHQKTIGAVTVERDAEKNRSSELAAQIKAEADEAKRKPMELAKADIDKKARDLGNRLLHLNYIQPAVAETFATHDVEKPCDARITIRGNAHALGDSVPRGFVKAAFTGTPPEIPHGQSGRLQLADWLTSPGNILTSRVTVNRIWQKLFGKGIVPSVDYFGLRGDKPTNTELLDFLATRFMQEGWSQKRLIREIMLSAAYRQTSGALQQRFRLDAESIRDAVLAISGNLVSSNGGPALALEYPENVSGLDSKNVNPVAFSLTKFRPEQACQRTIYQPVVRSSLQKGSAEILDIFDFPQPALFQGQRAITTVAPQALFLMNGPLLRNEAGRLADQLWKAQAPDDAARLADLYLRVLNRPVTDDESREALAFLSTFETPIAASDELPQRRHLAWASLCHALFTSNEFLFRL